MQACSVLLPAEEREDIHYGFFDLHRSVALTNLMIGTVFHPIWVW